MLRQSKALCERCKSFISTENTTCPVPLSSLPFPIAISALDVYHYRSINHHFTALFKLFDLIELIARFTSLVELSRLSQLEGAGYLSEFGLKQQIRLSRIKSPTMSDWLAITNTLSKERGSAAQGPKGSSAGVDELFGVWRDYVTPLNKGWRVQSVTRELRESAPEEVNKLRNRLAHGERLTEEQASLIFESREAELEALLTALSALSEHPLQQRYGGERLIFMGVEPHQCPDTSTSDRDERDERDGLYFGDVRLSDALITVDESHDPNLTPIVYRRLHANEEGISYSAFSGHISSGRVKDLDIVSELRALLEIVEPPTGEFHHITRRLEEPIYDERRGLLLSLSRALREERGSPVIWLTGKRGAGKSAALYHLHLRSRSLSDDPEYRSLNLREPYYALDGDHHITAGRVAEHWSYQLNRASVNPDKPKVTSKSKLKSPLDSLKVALKSYRGPALTLALDGLEAVQELESLLYVLSDHIRQADDESTPQLKWVLSGHLRAQERSLPGLWGDEVVAQPLPERDVRDWLYHRVDRLRDEASRRGLERRARQKTRQKTRQNVKREAEREVDTASLYDIVYRQSSGLPLFIKLYIEHLNSPDSDWSAPLPSGVDLYRELLPELSALSGAQHLPAELIMALAQSRRGLRDADVKSLMSTRYGESFTDETLRSLLSYVSGVTARGELGEVLLFTPALREQLLCDPNVALTRKSIEKLINEWVRVAWRSNSYARDYWSVHLRSEGAYVELIQLALGEVFEHKTRDLIPLSLARDLQEAALASLALDAPTLSVNLMALSTLIRHRAEDLLRDPSRLSLTSALSDLTPHDLDQVGDVFVQLQVRLWGHLDRGDQDQSYRALKVGVEQLSDDERIDLIGALFYRDRMLGQESDKESGRELLARWLKSDLGALLKLLAQYSHRYPILIHIADVIFRGHIADEALLSCARDEDSVESLVVYLTQDSSLLESSSAPLALWRRSRSTGGFDPALLADLKTRDLDDDLTLILWARVIARDPSPEAERWVLDELSRTSALPWSKILLKEALQAWSHNAVITLAQHHARHIRRLLPEELHSSLEPLFRREAKSVGDVKSITEMLEQLGVHAEIVNSLQRHLLVIYSERDFEGAESSARASLPPRQQNMFYIGASRHHPEQSWRSFFTHRELAAKNCAKKMTITAESAAYLDREQARPLLFRSLISLQRPLSREMRRLYQVEKIIWRDCLEAQELLIRLKRQPVHADDQVELFEDEMYVISMYEISSRPSYALVTLFALSGGIVSGDPALTIISKGLSDREVNTYRSASDFTWGLELSPLVDMIQELPELEWLGATLHDELSINRSTQRSRIDQLIYHLLGAALRGSSDRWTGDPELTDVVNVTLSLLRCNQERDQAHEQRHDQEQQLAELEVTHPLARVYLLLCRGEARQKLRESALCLTDHLILTQPNRAALILSRLKRDHALREELSDAMSESAPLWSLCLASSHEARLDELLELTRLAPMTIISLAPVSPQLLGEAYQRERVKLNEHTWPLWARALARAGLYTELYQLLSRHSTLDRRSEGTQLAHHVASLHAALRSAEDVASPLSAELSALNELALQRLCELTPSQ